MSYVTELDKDSVKSDFFAVIKPRRKVITWTLHASAVYWASVEEDYVFEVYEADIGDSLTPVNDIASVGNGDFFYDKANQKLYIKLSAAGDPNSNFITIAYGLFVSTDECHLSYIPDTTLSPVQYYDPRILSSPIFKQSNSDILFGFLAVSGTTLSLNNADGYFWPKSFDHSFNYAEVLIYHRLNDSVISKVFDGLAKNFKINTQSFDLELIDKIDTLETIYEEKYFSEVDFPNIDKNFLNYPIRKVYGRVNNFQPINIFKDDTASTTVNRQWCVSRNQTTKATLSTLIVVGSGSNTVSQSEVVDASGFVPGDNVVITSGGVPVYSLFVTAVNYTTNIIQHTAIPARVISAGDLIRRGFIGSVTILDENGSTWSPAAERDFGEVNYANDTKGFTFTNNFEASLVGFPSPFDPSKHKVWCTVYGEKDIPNFSGTATPVCTVAEKGGNLADPLGIIYDLLLERSRQFRLSSIDVANWQSIVALNDYSIGFAIPDSVNGDYPTLKELINNILRSAMLRFYSGLNTTVSKIGPIATTYKDVDASELTDIEFSSDYNDTYSEAEIHLLKGDLGVSAYDLDPYFTVSSQVGKELHRENKTYKTQVYLWDNSEASNYGDRIITYLGERKMVMQAVLSTKFFGADLSKAVNLKLDALPGFDLVKDTERSRNYQIIETGKGYKGVTLTLEDQKGIEDNSGVW